MHIAALVAGSSFANAPSKGALSKLGFVLIASVAILVAGQTSASARICQRVCDGGICWSDCSKIPGQTSVSTIKGATVATSQSGGASAGKQGGAGAKR
jgi:hypothetical protein